MSNTVTADDIIPPHEVQDENLLTTLTNSMRTTGWNGAPIVWDPTTSQALTGSHRIAAAHAAGINVPVIDVRTIATDAGHDWDQILEDTADGWLTDPFAAVAHLATLIPADTAAHYGLDAH